jgi:hypothetical protein
MSWLITGTQKTDPDALAYLAEVERADGQALESGVRNAVIAFVTGCKADGIWSAVKASCILAGARTLTGALVPLVGTAPTNFNFASGDYNRKTGLTGDGSAKFLNSNRANTADPQDSNHNAVYLSALGAGAVMNAGLTTAANNIFVSAGNILCRNRSSGSSSASGSTGFAGHSRNNSANFVVRIGGVNTSQAIASLAPVAADVLVFRRDTASGTPAIAFYSIGESLDLALLDARVTTLIQAIDAAI